MAFLVEHGRPKPIEAKPAAALPSDAFRDATLFAVDHLFQPWRAVGDGVLAHLDTDVAASHFVRNRRRRPGTKEGVEDEIAGLSRLLKLSFVEGDEA